MCCVGAVKRAVKPKARPDAGSRVDCRPKGVRKESMMRTCVLAACVAALAAVSFSGCSSVGSMAGGGSDLFSRVGGGNLRNMAGDLVNKSLRDPRLASLTGGRDIDSAASAGKVSNQLCSMMGGGCRAPLNNTELAEGASRVTPEQSQALSEHFDSSLVRASPDPAVRDRIRQAVGDKIPSVMGGIL